jgi:hypothetical protein
MRSFRVALTVAVVALGTAAVLAEGPARDDRFVVHEWGTFTSMQGQDGLALEGLSREEESLPTFVYSRSKVRDCPLRGQGWKGLEVPANHVTQKMETPVIYFRSATPRKVRVRVDFVKGLISQWYPVSDLLGPPEGTIDAKPLDVSKVDRSFLQWDVDVLPREAAQPAEVPTVDAKNPWSFAREVDASWIRTLPRKAPRAGPVEAERYLFYRGLGNFRMPLAAEARSDAEFVLKNDGAAAIAWPLLLQVEGDRARISTVESVGACGARTLTFENEPWRPLDGVIQKMQAWLQERLESANLTADEARAMVRTWARSWFRCEGARVLWIVPRANVDALLPLSIDPAPDELVRVLVGRLEIVTPQVAAEVERAIRDRTSRDATARDASKARLERLGRFLEPHVRNVLARTKDELARSNGEALLAKIASAEAAK